MEEFILKHNTCILGTGYNNYVRCTLIEFNYYKNHFYFFSEGGNKFISLEHNNQVSIAIYDNYDGFQKLGSLQIQGKVSVVESFSDEYDELLSFKKLSKEALKHLDYEMYLLRVDITEVDLLNTELKKMGYSSRQKIVF